MTEKQKACCPSCRSTDLKLIGGVIVSNTGIDYASDQLPIAMVKELADSGSAFTRELLVCAGCEKQCLLTAAQAAADLVPEEYLWATTPWGTKIPIQCPECGNHKTFIRKIVVAVEGLQDCALADKEETEGAIGYDMDTPLDELTVAYLCDADDNCEGEVVIVPGTIELSMLSES